MSSYFKKNDTSQSMILNTTRHHYKKNMVQNILFICSQNWHRSKTAETIFSKQNRFNVRSAGTNSYAETPLSIDLLNWADNIFVMEDHHKEKIINKFP
jgi:protein-tyrosine phosphatase